MGRVVFVIAETIWKCGGRVTSPILCLCWCWATCLFSPFSYIIGKGKEEAGRPIQIRTPGSLLPNAESEPKNFECSTFKTDTQSLKFLLRGVLCTPWGVGIFKLKIWISWRNRNFVKKHLKLQYYQEPSWKNEARKSRDTLQLRIWSILTHIPRTQTGLTKEVKT